MTTYIYCRVSTTDQNVDQQIAVLTREYEHDVIVSEKASGKDLDRPKFEAMRKKLRAGDTVIVFDMSRIGRNLRAVLEFVEECAEHDISLRIHNLGINTQTPSGKMTLSILGAVAEMERAQMLEKQRIGIERAKAEGKYQGKARINDKRINAALNAVANGSTMQQAANDFGVGVATLYRRKAERA